MGKGSTSHTHSYVYICVQSQAFIFGVMEILTTLFKGYHYYRLILQMKQTLLNKNKEWQGNNNALGVLVYNFNSIPAVDVIYKLSLYHPFSCYSHPSTTPLGPKVGVFILVMVQGGGVALQQVVSVWNSSLERIQCSRWFLPFPFFLLHTDTQSLWMCIYVFLRFQRSVAPDYMQSYYIWCSLCM